MLGNVDAGPQICKRMSSASEINLLTHLRILHPWVADLDLKIVESGFEFRGSSECTELLRGLAQHLDIGTSVI